MVGSVFTEAQPGPTLTSLCFEIAYSLLRKIVEREFQILTLMNFHEPLQIKCNFQRPSSSDSPLPTLLLGPSSLQGPFFKKKIMAGCNFLEYFPTLQKRDKLQKVCRQDCIIF